MTEIERLQKAIEDLHGAVGEYLTSVPVCETFQDQTVWEGSVEVFKLVYHVSGANRAYAWSYEDDKGQTRYVAVLGVPPVNSALDAVRAYVAAHIQKQLK